jgi:hypothetical protein
MKIAIAFYGITRSLRFTSESILSNIIAPAKAAGEVAVYCHFFKQHSINNPRTGEVGPLDVNEWQLIHPDVSLIEEIDLPTEDQYLGPLLPYGNAWEDEGQSMRNIVRQLISLKRVTHLVQQAGGADIVIFVRPDMWFHDAFAVDAWRSVIHANTTMLPNWQWSGGLNDRFSICGKNAYAYYGLRIDQAVNFCSHKQRPLHSERLLMYALMHAPIQLATTGLRATRVRSNGERANEGFGQVKFLKRLQAFLYCNVYTQVVATGLRLKRYMNA